MREWRNWQTRMIQVHVYVRTCRFKSCFPHHGTPCKSRGSDFLCAEIPKPYPNDTQSSHVIYEGLHPVCRLPAHGVRHVAVAVQGEGCRVVPHVFLQGFDVVPRPDGIDRECMPLWYNRKKRGSPYFTRGCAVCRCEISPFPALKWQRKICPGKEVCYANTKKQAKMGTKRSQK